MTFVWSTFIVHVMFIGFKSSVQDSEGITHQILNVINCWKWNSEKSLCTYKRCWK
jgi:hypothetical protein